MVQEVQNSRLVHSHLAMVSTEGLCIIIFVKIASFLASLRCKCENERSSSFSPGYYAANIVF